jgi:hypothetical protein
MKDDHKYVYIQIFINIVGRNAYGLLVKSPSYIRTFVMPDNINRLNCLKYIDDVDVEQIIFDCGFYLDGKFNKVRELRQDDKYIVDTGEKRLAIE